MQTRTARLHNCVTNLTNSFSRWNLKMASVRPKHVVSNFFVSWFLIITSIRKLLVVLLTASPYRHLTSLNIQRTPVPLSTAFKNIFKKSLHFPPNVYLCVSSVWQNRLNYFSTQPFKAHLCNGGKICFLWGRNSISKAV